MSYFTFKQNNSEGWFDGPAIFLIVEACDVVEAHSIAEKHGAYFEDAEEVACPCCDPRWTAPVETEIPKLDWQPLDEAAVRKYRRRYRRFRRMPDTALALVVRRGRKPERIPL